MRLAAHETCICLWNHHAGDRRTFTMNQSQHAAFLQIASRQIVRPYQIKLTGCRTGQSKCVEALFKFSQLHLHRGQLFTKNRGFHPVPHLHLLHARS